MYKLVKQYRYKGYNYAQSGLYFITIVTKERMHYFGEIINNEMVYSDIGTYTKENILKFVPNENFQNPYIKNDSKYIISIDEWTILPNHIHLIVEIFNTVNEEDEEETYDENLGIRPLQIGSIGTFINHFKGNIKKYSNALNVEFHWQARFHDRIIRDQNEYYSIKQYIKNNVENFENDVP